MPGKNPCVVNSFQLPETLDAGGVYFRPVHMFLLGQHLGKYEILKTLGSGGFGTVYLVRDTWIDKKVAIKVPTNKTGSSTSC